VAGQPAFSGGLAMNTPVGAVFSPNITPSKSFGIGNYTDQQFWNALHNGIAPGSSLLVFPKYLYPSMPYDAYSKLSYADVMAIKAYLDSLPPAEIPSRQTQIPFPLNIRAALLGWRILFFHPQPVQYDASWSPQVRNGAFLVQALAHCSDCHTPRNLLFASETSKFLGGGQILAQSWYAPNISSASQNGGVGGWSQADLVAYLHNGAGAPVGPMQEVVQDSLSRLPASDVQDIAAYLQTATTPQTPAAPPANGMVADGAQVYADHCARCHGANGEGVGNNFPNLAGNQAIWDGPSNDIISMVLGGFGPWHNDQSAMPGFRQTLTDGQIAAVANYLRTSWGNHGVADATAAKVADLRSMTADAVSLSTGTTTATLQSGGNVTKFDEISGAFSRDGDEKNCQLNAHFAVEDAAAPVDLAGACAEDGGVLQGIVTMHGETSAVKLRLSNVKSGVVLYGPLGNGARLEARIALVTPNG
jgi:mono/diheme cytochrome c family protein